MTNITDTPRQGKGCNHLAQFIILIVFFYLTGASTVNAVDISDTPLDVTIQAASPVVMFLLDNSSSMDFNELIPEENGGQYYIDGTDCPYIYSFDMLLDYKTVVPANYWKLRWAGYNKLYYTPDKTYTPWPSNETIGETLDDADIQNPRSDPMDSSTTFTLSDSFYSAAQPDDEKEFQSETRIDQAGPGYVIKVELGETFTLNDDEGLEVIIKRDNLSTQNDTIAPSIIFQETGTGTETRINANDASCGEFGTTGTWYTSSFSSCVSGEDCPSEKRNKYTKTVGDQAIYSPILTAGTYKIFYYVDSYTSDRDTNANLSVYKTKKKIYINVSHYYLHNDANANGEVDSGEIYLVNIDGSDTSNITRTYYQLTTDDISVDDGELTPISSLPTAIRPSLSSLEDLQNFANWFSYYSRRHLTAKAAIGQTITQLSDKMMIGLYDINKDGSGNDIINQEALLINVKDDDGNVDNTNKKTLLRVLYNGVNTGSTPLRQGLIDIAEYYKGQNTAIGDSPYKSNENGGACQQVYTVVMTDGYWDWSIDSSFGDLDGDGNSNTLSDIAYHYFENDLSGTLDDMVNSTSCFDYSHQRMVVFGVALGVSGTLSPVNSCNPTLAWASPDTTGTPAWPVLTALESKPAYDDWNNQERSTPKKIDDLWHATVNANGEFYSASDAKEVAESLSHALETISARELHGASVAVSTERVYSSEFLYEGSYLSSDWSGDLQAHEITVTPTTDSTTGTISYDVSIDEEQEWSAAEKLAQMNPDDRKIITYNGDDKEGAPFQWSSLTDNQKNYMLGLASDNSTFSTEQDETGTAIVNYLRGDDDDNTDYRTRGTININGTDYYKKLGDIVNSSPVIVDDLVYVGANDGMLHAFSVDTGIEKFAYIPNLVFETLAELADPNYSHLYYVDQTPTYAKFYNTDTASYEKNIIGGLGKGGKGYYCLNVTNVASLTTEADLAGMLKWEFTDDKMGYSFSKPAVVKTNSTDHPYVVIFGNGYNSTDGYGYFYFIDLITGEELFNEPLATYVGDDNGISSVLATDVNNDVKADYIYAGDLKGNLWKLDITSDDYTKWGFAFGTTSDPEPLITTRENQPITTRPDVSYHPSRPGYFVVFGTGRYLGAADLVDSSEQAVYGVWDYGDDDDNGEYPGPVGDAFVQTIVTGGTSYTLNNYAMSNQRSNVGLMIQDGSNYPIWKTIADADDTNSNQTSVEGQLPNPDTNSSIGWYIPLTTTYARVIHDPFIRSGYAIVTAYTPSQDTSACGSGGSAHLMLIDRNTGSYDTVDDDDFDDPNAPPVVIVTPDGNEVLIYNSEIPPDEDSLGGASPVNGIFFWQEIGE